MAVRAGTGNNPTVGENRRLPADKSMASAAVVPGWDGDVSCGHSGGIGAIMATLTIQSRIASQVAMVEMGRQPSLLSMADTALLTRPDVAGRLTRGIDAVVAGRTVGITHRMGISCRNPCRKSFVAHITLLGRHDVFGRLPRSSAAIVATGAPARSDGQSCMVVTRWGPRSGFVAYAAILIGQDVRNWFTGFYSAVVASRTCLGKIVMAEFYRRPP
jgi:hypothetical protein